MPTEPTTEWEKIHADAPFFDLHIHPALNHLAIKQNLNIRHIVSRSFNPFAVRASWPEIPRLTQRLLVEGYTLRPSARYWVGMCCGWCVTGVARSSAPSLPQLTQHRQSEASDQISLQIWKLFNVQNARYGQSVEDLIGR